MCAAAGAGLGKLISDKGVMEDGRAGVIDSTAAESSFLSAVSSLSLRPSRLVVALTMEPSDFPDDFLPPLLSSERWPFQPLLLFAFPP